MRRWFVIFLIVLLPWRAWAADAMTLSMSGAGDHPASAAVPHCPDHLPAVADLANDNDGPSEGTGETTPHSVCDICNGPALTASVPVVLAEGFQPQTCRASGPVHFVSASPHPGRKPPIS